jgi:hypothetical protein
MAQISIIEVNLGINISDLINEDVVGLVGEAQQELETAIAVAKKTVALKEQKQREAQEVVDKTQIAMMKAYDMLVKAGNEGVLAADILAVTADTVPQASAFALRMKRLLKEDGNKYALVRKQVKSKPYYIFLRYNLTTEESVESSVVEE